MTLRNRQRIASSEEAIPEADVDVTLVQNQINNARPVLDRVARVVNFIGPFIEAAVEFLHQTYLKLTPYHPEKLIPALVGLFLTFAGASYMTVIAAFEAFRVTGGWEATQEAVDMLYRNYKAAKVANEKDNTVDEDNDGIADVLQISDKERVTRKLLLVAKTIDPMEVQQAYSSIVMAFFAVIATLKVRFAEALTLGATLGEMLERAVTPYFSPGLKKLIPEDYHKWIPVIISLITKSIGVSLAWTLMRFIAAFYTSVRGAYLLVGGLLFYAKEMGFLSGDAKIHSASLIFNASQGVVALVGLWWQISSGFAIPFPFNVLLMPLTFLETFLQFFVAHSD